MGMNERPPGWWNPIFIEEAPMSSSHEHSIVRAALKLAKLADIASAENEHEAGMLIMEIVEAARGVLHERKAKSHE